jgi:hypothetical protein
MHEKAHLDDSNESLGFSGSTIIYSRRTCVFLYPIPRYAIYAFSSNLRLADRHLLKWGKIRYVAFPLHHEHSPEIFHIIVLFFGLPLQMHYPESFWEVFPRLEECWVKAISGSRGDRDSAAISCSSTRVGIRISSDIFMTGLVILWIIVARVFVAHTSSFYLMGSPE